MTQNPYPVGMHLILIPGTSLWGQAHTEGRSDMTFEVVAQVDDGTGMARVTLRPLDSCKIAFHGINAHLFSPVSSTASSRSI